MLIVFALLAQQEIPKEKFQQLHALIKPPPAEYAWRNEIPWTISVREARKRAAAEDKPILIWSTGNGYPMNGG